MVKHRTFSSYQTLDKVPRTGLRTTPNTQRQLAKNRTIHLDHLTYHHKDGVKPVDKATRKLAIEAEAAVKQREANPAKSEEIEEWAEDLATASVWDGEGRTYKEFEEIVAFMKKQGHSIPPKIQQQIDAWEMGVTADPGIEQNEDITITATEKVMESKSTEDNKPVRVPPGTTEVTLPSNVKVMESKSTEDNKPVRVPPGTGRNQHQLEIDEEGKPFPAPHQETLNINAGGGRRATPMKPKSNP